jgi:serine/threonine-protein kinase ULK2
VERLNKKLKDNLYSEIHILKSLRHPHIVALHDCVESATHINLIMEYCELGDLSLFIKKRDKLGTNPATHDMARKYPGEPNSGLHEVVIRHFLKQLTSALKFLREKNYVHRDVKPQNLLLLPSAQFRQENPRPILTASEDSLIPVSGIPSLPMLKLADFGFARVLPSTSLAETLCGSPLYMAPEILRYEKYDAKADLWSVGTVLYEMVSGRPPFRARNHVELLRRIEAAEDIIKFPRETKVTPEMKALTRALLKRNPVERMSFDAFFSHSIVAGPIPGLVEDDLPRPSRRNSRELRGVEDVTSRPRGLSLRQPQSDNDPMREAAGPSRSPGERPLRSPTAGSPGEKYARQLAEGTTRVEYSPGREAAEGLGIHRHDPQPSSPTGARPRGSSNPMRHRQNRGTPSPTSSLHDEQRGKGRPRHGERSLSAVEKAAQDVADERDYVLVDRKHVEVNALADQMAVDQVPLSPKSAGQMVRRATQQGNPTSTTGAVATQSSRAVEIAQGRVRPGHDRRGSYDRGFSGSPSSTPSFITKAIHDASLRLFGVKYPSSLIGKGQSPPQFYSPFPAYPTPNTAAGLISDGKHHVVDEDARAVKAIEDLATRSDVVYGFAEVKYKQLVPLAPSMSHGLGGVSPDQLAADEEDLTVEAVVSLSEEALVLYVKALMLLAKGMDIAGLWWSRKNRSDSASTAAISSREASYKETVAGRINMVVQWIRLRFNEVLEKTEVVRLRLVDGQKLLPEDHPSHPNNHGLDSISSTSSGTKHVFLTPGISAEKLMYDRALDMSRTAAIDEITNENLEGCETYYITAIRMLEAVLDTDGETVRRKYSGSGKDSKDVQDEITSDLDSDDQQIVHKSMSPDFITTRISDLINSIPSDSNDQR